MTTIEPQRQVYFSLSHDEDQQMWQAFREGCAASALELIITRHVAREHHAGRAERADAWDEGVRAQVEWQRAQNAHVYDMKPEPPPLANPYRADDGSAR
jgi:hypothetical protein